MRKLQFIRFTWFFIFTIFFSPLMSFTAFAGENTWTPLAQVGQGCCPQPQTFTVDTDNPTILYAGTLYENAGLFKSTDSGQSWQRLNAGLPDVLPVTAIAVAPGASNVIFIGTRKGIFRSTDSGTTWTEVTNDSSKQLSNATNLEFSRLVISPDYKTDQTVFISASFGKNEGRILRSSNAGTSWQAVPVGTALGAPGDIAISPDFASDHTVFFTGGGHVYKSLDRGDNWQYIPVPGELINNIALSPTYAKDRTIFVGAIGAVHKSTDDGATWTSSVIAPYQGYLVTVSPNFAIDRAVFVSVSDKGVYRSFGGISDWTPINEGLTELNSGELHFAGPGRLILNTLRGLWTYTGIGLQLPSAPVGVPTTTNPDLTYFPETNHTLAFGFKNFWEGNGGLPVFGFPLTEEFKEANQDTGKVYTVQYFERQRFEYHPENKGTPYETQLGLIGVSSAFQNKLLGTPPFQPANASNNPNCQYFPETSHQICNSFLFYWQSHGLEFGDPGVSFREALALFGLPISEEFTQDGLIVQYFERAVFEYHPENNGTAYEVLLKRLGAEVLSQRGW